MRNSGPTAYELLATPPVDRLDQRSCGYLAYEDERIAEAINDHAEQLFATYRGEVALVVAELRDLAALVLASGRAYRAAGQHGPPRRAGLPAQP